MRYWFVSNKSINSKTGPKNHKYQRMHIARIIVLAFSILWFTNHQYDYKSALI